jgi:hypothetical protein
LLLDKVLDRTLTLNVAEYDPIEYLNAALYLLTALAFVANTEHMR